MGVSVLGFFLVRVRQFLPVGLNRAKFQYFLSFLNERAVIHRVKYGPADLDACSLDLLPDCLKRGSHFPRQCRGAARIVPLRLRVSLLEVLV